MKPFWVTFYSYKGGVGRSMALANLAALLASKGRSVLMIDFDLEAPGLDSFPEFGIEQKRDGVVEYAYEFQRTRIAPELAPYVQECKFERPLRGKVWLMPSGRKDDPTYNVKRTSLQWEQWYESELGELFVENWKIGVQKLFKPDYVFVDSRTGLTDVGGVCTLHLPDLVVLLFALNDQNLHGICGVLQTIRDAPREKPPQILPVATPVPNLPRDEDSLLETRFKKAEALLGLKIETSIGYNQQAALVEKLFTLDTKPTFVRVKGKVQRVSSRVALEYEALLRAIQDRNKDGLDSLIDKANRACAGDEEIDAEKIRQVLIEDFGDRADALYAIGEIDKVSRGRDEALQAWRQALDLEPSHADAFRSVVSIYRQRKQFDEVLRLYAARIAHATKISPESLPDIHREQAEQLMVLERFKDAAKSYAHTLKEKGDDAQLRLANLFNTAEAQRRATGSIDTVACRQVIELFEREIKLENLDLATQANIVQAMHVPYACTGRIEDAKELLFRARRCAAGAGKTETIFCVKPYAYLPVEEFLKANEEMLGGLEKNRLWDGTKLPMTAEVQTTQ